MTLLPVIERELRAESRHSATYWLRVLGAATLLMAAMVCWLDGGFRDQKGDDLFYVLHQTLFWAIWILVPLLAADCISHERREGTLGLLFLTPLRAREVVLAKGLAHGLKGMTASLAALPIVVVPFLMGGVDWRLATASIFLNLTSFCWALGAGLLASSRNRTLTGALCWAMLWAFLFFWLMVWACGFLFVSFVFSPRYTAQFSPLLSYSAAGLAAVFRFFDMWQWGLRRAGPPGMATWLAWYACLLGASVFSLLCATLLAAGNVRRKWQENPPSVQRLKLEKALFTPAYGMKFFRRWMRWTLERNPIGWLERRTWSGRLVSWSWLAILIALFSWSLDNFGYGFALRAISTTVPWMLMLSMALSAAGSFRRERELGMMELLLVTPLRVGQIISGRVRGLWGQFLPAVLLLMGIWLFLTSGKGLGEHWRNESAGGGMLLWLLGFAFLTLPIIGLYFSLRCRHFIVALFMTGLIGIVLPSASIDLMVLFSHDKGLPILIIASPFACPALAIAIWRLWKFAEYRGLMRRAVASVVFLVVFFVVAEHFSSGSLLSRILDEEGAPALLLLPALQCGLALLCGRLLHRRLVKRIFAFPA